MRIACLKAQRGSDNGRILWRITLAPYSPPLEPFRLDSTSHIAERVSLLFPLTSASFVLPRDRSAFHISLIGVRNPMAAYTAIAHTTAIPRSLASLGAAALVVWSNEDPDKAEWTLRFTDQMDDALTFIEHWSISPDGLLEVASTHRFGQIESVPADVLPSHLLEHRSQTTISEASYHAAMLASHAPWFFPEIAAEISLVRSKISTAIHNLSSLCHESPNTATPSSNALSDNNRHLSLPSHAVTKSRGSPIHPGDALPSSHATEPTGRDAVAHNPSQQAEPQELSPNLHRRCEADSHVASLIELSSALAYAHSQALAGITPVVEHPGLLYPHTLLGANTAWRAVNRTCLEVFSVLREVNFPEQVRQRLTGELPEQTADNPTLSPRIVHFSGRHGFGETETAITYPTQSLSHCISPNWTLTTVTHETLHSEVRLLLSAVFAIRVGPRLLKFPDCLIEVAGRYLQKVAPLKGRHALQKIRALTDPQERLAFELLWCALCFAEAYNKASNRLARKAGEPPERFDPVLPCNPDRFISRVKTALKVFEELFVHTLDFEYFFGGNPHCFAKCIWSSWSMIPTVASNLDMYLLRTLAVLAGRHEGQDYSRLREAKNELARALKELGQAHGSSEVIRYASAVLAQEQGPEKTWMDRVFPESVRFVDIVRNHLLSRELSERFRHQENDYATEDYLLGEFVAPSPKTALELLQRHRYAELTSGGTRRDRTSELRDSAWLLVAIASVEGT